MKFSFLQNLFSAIVVSFWFVAEVHSQEENLLLKHPIVKAAGNNTLFYTGVLGNILKSTTPNKGRAHVFSSALLTNADYSRGAFDGVPEELENFAVSFNMSAIFQILKSNGFIHHGTITFGTQQGLSNNDFDHKQLKWWYESNYYSGFTLVFSDILASAIHYLVATSPNIGTVGNELDFALSYIQKNSVGWWEPTLELSVPLGKSEGVLLQIAGNPSFNFFQKCNYSFTITFPLRAGAGIHGYYVENDDITKYFSIGITGQLSPRNIPETFGKWNLFMGADMVGRDEELAEIDIPFDNGGKIVVLGRVGLSILY